MSCKHFDYEGARFCSMWFRDENPSGSDEALCRNENDNSCSHFETNDEDLDEQE